MRSIAFKHRHLITTIKARKMVKTQRFSVDQNALLERACRLPVSHIPGRHIKSGGAQNGNLVKKTRRQIDPLLVSKQAHWKIIVTVF